MTRPASFNKIWGYEALQIADENNEKTQEFMRSGWEGGSDKKAPSASVQNYHMQKTDQALQEVERQGYLSWRSDVPYSKGARVFFHGSTFHALKDNQDVEPQGSRDNNVWYLIPVQVYPTRYESVEGLGTAATHAASDFDPSGSATDAKNAAIAASNQRDSSRRVGFIGGDKLNPYIEHWDGKDSTIIGVARSDWVSDLSKSVDNRFNNLGSASTKDASYFQIAGKYQPEGNYTNSDTSRRVGFVDGDALNPYIERWDGNESTIVPVARSAWVSEATGNLNKRLDSLGTLSSQNSDYVNITGGNVTAANFVSTRNADTYRIVTGSSSESYGSFWRMDGSNLYLMITNKGDPYGTWRDAASGGMPLYINYKEKTLGFNNNVEFKGGIEIYNGSGTGFIDWHFGGDGGDYTSRIIEKTKGELTATGSMAFGNARKTLDNLGFDVNKQTKGHQQIGADGIIIQWGPWSSPARGAGLWTGFDKSFPNACMGVVVGVQNAASQMAGARDYNNGGFIATTGNEDPLARNGWYIAIGW